MTSTGGQRCRGLQRVFVWMPQGSSPYPDSAQPPVKLKILLSFKGTKTFHAPCASLSPRPPLPLLLLLPPSGSRVWDGRGWERTSEADMRQGEAGRG
ncbi:hypothetical protein E2C01_068163 [Portunus trituberculatus]|uniref:Uncharacterized protein n=1 Tax=Portunus trituberculatus TaxID=210409 RepID=A0A5B7HV20_PORTR|nr:hypothetical protein [Portunus trituberculatus]